MSATRRLLVTIDADPLECGRCAHKRGHVSPPFTYCDHHDLGGPLLGESNAKRTHQSAHSWRTTVIVCLLRSSRRTSRDCPRRPSTKSATSGAGWTIYARR